MAYQDAAIPFPGFISLGMQTDERDVHAVMRLLDAHKPKLIIEIGVWTGGMTTLFAERADRVICVDHWLGSPTDHSREMLRLQGGSSVAYHAFFRNLADSLFTKVFPVRGGSREIAALWPPHLKADLIYIDAGHGYEDCSADIAAWLPHVREGGVLAGHDYCDSFPGVKRAVDEIGPDHRNDPNAARVWWKLVGFKTPPGRPRLERQARRPRPGGETGRRAFSTAAKK